MRKGRIRAILPCALVLAFISAQMFILLYLRSRAGHPSMLPDEEPRAGKRRQARLERETLNFNLKGRSDNGEDMSMHQNALAVPPSIISMAPSANSTTTTTLSSSSPSSPTGNANRSKALVANVSSGLDEWRALSSRPSPIASMAAPAKQPAVAPGLHIFYYAWYGTPAVDGRWVHWNHEVLADWDAMHKKIMYNPPVGSKHKPEEGDVGSNFYPAIGPYSSKNATVVDMHVRMIAEAGIGSIVYSWWGRGMGDANGDPTDEAIIEMMLERCLEYGVTLAFHIEPYKGRNAKSVADDARYIANKYGSHPSLCRDMRGRPVLYVYDSYHTRPEEWAGVFTRSEDLGGLRGGEGDAFFIGLWVEAGHGGDLARGGFDGAYTYFATDGMTYGSSRQNWGQMSVFAKQNGMKFVPSSGPGYIDTAIRPWNAGNSRDRESGGYFARALEGAIALDTDMVSITSFNEWHEGTQIEPAAPAHRMAVGSRKYDDYGSDGGDAYLTIVRRRVDACFARGGKWCAHPLTSN